MPVNSFQIRLCESCGLRYPLTEGHSFGERCPICIGTTRLLLTRNLIVEPTRSLTTSTSSVQRPNPSPSGRRGLAVLLDNIRSAWNVGSILRSADGFGFNHAFLCGITPTPDNEAVTKTSLGAEASVTWSYHKDAVKLAKGLKKSGWAILGLEEHSQAKSIRATSFLRSAERTALLLGNEVAGIDPGLLKVCDDVYEIPMRGEKKSFNVAIAFSIAAYQLTALTPKRTSNRAASKRQPAPRQNKSGR